MAGNTVYVQGSYVDVHDNEVVNLSIDKATVRVDANNDNTAAPAAGPSADADAPSGDELCHFIHPSVGSDQEWLIHDEIRRLVARQGIQEICRYLVQMRSDKKVLLPQSPSAAYAELVRMGMPSGEGFNESTFRKYYRNK